MTHSIDISELNKILSTSEAVTILDVRRKTDYQADPRTIGNAAWRDPEKINDWVKQLRVGERAVVYCVKGGSVRGPRCPVNSGCASSKAFTLAFSPSFSSAW
ncbi:MAG: hypothetical protein KFF50_15170, partial [Desulfatitalea sp.]|nr:hypothetical protein [Desulfatitalea sp.]